MSNDEKMCIIGFGRMGRYAAGLFSQDFQVNVVSSREVGKDVEAQGAVLAENSDQAIAETHYIFLALPVDAIRLWTPKINKLTSVECIVIDCCTVRTAAAKEISKIKRRSFGLPELHSEVIPVIGNPDKRIKEVLNRKGYKLLKMSGEDYDKNSVAVGIAHFLGITLDLSLNQVERKHLLGAKSGSFIMRLIEHLKTNSSTTYRETQVMNPNMSQARKKFIASLQKIDEELDTGIFRFEAYSREKWRP